ncbi:unnamed protein product [Heligmosomoides polygyrus]|uniref:SAC3/GANP family protein n=1 Tax=Heligmosomoides polygyrus TaxID=6339 RepID=A0A183F9M6_HELPZ|nr:unnamed protein product [Heligmosomoides polygyrus]
MLFRSDKELWEGGGRDLIDRVDRLLGHLFEYRLVRETSDCMENGMSRTVQLLRYYEKYRHHNLYITYVYKLYDLHMLYNNQIEAAKTLLLYANTLSVSIFLCDLYIHCSSLAFHLHIFKPTFALRRLVLL